MWEKHETTVTKFQDFLKNGLKINDPDKIELVDIHRLPQHPAKKNGRFIIVKLFTKNDKNLIFKFLKNLKFYNIARKVEDNTTPYIYVTEHLPKKFQDQRNRLLPIFNEARKNNQKTIWKATDGNYTLFVDGKRIDPPAH